MMSIDNFINNIKMAYYGVSFECRDPYKRTELENKLKEFNFKYAPGYVPVTDFYIYTIKGGNKKRIPEFLDWFRKKNEAKYHSAKSIFKTKIHCFCWPN